MAEQNQELRKAGLKVTLPRVKILQILEDSEGGSQHLGAEDVYRALLAAGEDVGLATVYRVLTQFESAGLVTRHHFETGHSVFELAKGEPTIIWSVWVQVTWWNLPIQSLSSVSAKSPKNMGMN